MNIAAVIIFVAFHNHLHVLSNYVKAYVKPKYFCLFGVI